MQWIEIPRDWRLDGNPDRVNAEIRAHIGRRNLTRQQVADIIGLKRQALARRLDGETPWRWSELIRLANTWELWLYDLTGSENPTNGTRPRLDL